MHLLLTRPISVRLPKTSLQTTESSSKRLLTYQIALAKVEVDRSAALLYLEQISRTRQRTS